MSDVTIGQVKRGRKPGRKNIHEPVHEPVRSGKVTVKGRDGEELFRTRTSNADPFELPLNLKEKGWSYQWIPLSVAGDTEVVADQNLAMYGNGWRPVNSGPLVKYFMPAGYSGVVVRGRQGLYERPESLSIEARNEEIAKARRQMSDRDQSLMGGKANIRNLPSGFEMGGKYRGTGGDIKITVDRSLDIPAPSHTLAGSDE